MAKAAWVVGHPSMQQHRLEVASLQPAG